MFTNNSSILPTNMPPTINIQHYSDNDSILHNGQVIHTPGHTQGSVCLYWPDISLLCTGDTLFLGSVGRTDLYGGSQQQLIHSIQNKLYTLSDTTLCLPGHMSYTSIGYEKYNSLFIQAKNKQRSAL